ncbi:MAG TPA: hypothetical protein VK989_03835 [Polyangia bacterium]|jgi:hypothetical protein|nr:hypothetical protein [Polyangia bacterium]
MITRILSRSAVARFSLAIALVGLTSVMLPKSALAATATCVPTDVAYNQSGAETIVCGGTTFTASNSNAPTGCITQFIDTIKLWSSLAQAALLSGKNIQVTFTSCGGQNSVQKIDLLQ